MILAFVCSECGGFFFILASWLFQFGYSSVTGGCQTGLTIVFILFFCRFFSCFCFFFARGRGVFFSLLLSVFVWPEIAKRWEWMSPPGQHLPKILHGFPALTNAFGQKSYVLWLAFARPAFRRSAAGVDNTQRIAPSKPFVGSCVHLFFSRFLFLLLAFWIYERTFSYGSFYKLWTSQWLLGYCYSIRIGLFGMRPESRLVLMHNANEISRVAYNQGQIPLWRWKKCTWPNKAMADWFGLFSFLGNEGKFVDHFKRNLRSKMELFTFIYFNYPVLFCSFFINYNLSFCDWLNLFMLQYYFKVTHP